MSNKLLLDNKKINEVIDVVDESGEEDEDRQAAVGIGFILGKYTDVELSVKKRQRDGKYIAEVKQEIDLVGLFQSIKELISARRK